ncbi:MAG: class I SAM-dependent methyltransferase [Methanosarcinaceae archaeon]|nr:class I SAM-dependent methyltransferase [Methanosarcinaceae archaeon]
MFLKELFDVDEEIYLVEPNYYSQRTIESTIKYLENIRDIIETNKLRIIRITTGGKTVGLAIFNPATPEVPIDFWSIFTSAITSFQNAEFESLADSIIASNEPERVIEVTHSNLHEALIEYYSVLLVNRETCTDCTMQLEPYNSVYAEDRIDRLLELLERLGSEGLSFEGNMLEICCGNGMSTIALHRLGYDPLSIDYEKCEVCQGLEHGVLNPRRTLVMDATKLSRFLEPERFDCIVGFMLGTIYEFNKDIWSRMMVESAKVAREGATILFTVRSKPEMDLLEKALQYAGIEGRAIDNNDSSGMYDQWVFVGTKIRK